ncbi:MAG TPA: insulinase family protein [Elusimicrobia bacterium]|nr:insulinase family protein [Elusimicrobiota bacterium]
MKKIILALLLSAVLIPQAAMASIKLPSGVTKGASVEGIDEYFLPNGLKVLLFPDPTKPTVTVNVTYKVGSRHENYGETGMAHLLEHLMFKGTPKYPDMTKEFTAHGTRNNASTSYDRTNYYETLAATDENLEWALDLEADRMVNSFIAKKDLDSEMTVVRNEFESRENNPRGILMERVLSTSYLWHNYGKAVIGARSDIENVSIDRLQAFYRRYYRPDNAVLIVAGNFAPEKTLALVKKKFGRIKPPKEPMQPTYTVDPVQDGERLITLRRSGDTQEIIAAYHVPAASHPDSAALDVLGYILGDTPSGRLYKALVETKKAASAAGFSWALREGGVMMFLSTVRKGSSLDEARDILLRTVEESAAGEFAEADVERARTAMLKNVEMAMKSSERIATALSESIAAGDWRLFFIDRDRIKSVTPADVKRVAAHYLKPSNRTLGLFVPTEKPDRSEIPPMPDVQALVRDYKGGEAVSAGESFDSSPENIDARTVRRTLRNGMKLVMLPKKTRGSSVNVSLTLRKGSLETLRGLGEVPSFASDMLTRGTAKRTRQQVQDELDRIKTRARITGGSSSIETDAENLEAALRLAAEMLKEPAYPEKEFEVLKQETLAALEKQRGQPDFEAMNAWRRHMRPYPSDDPRYTATLDEQIAQVKAVTLEDLKAYHRDYYGASAGELALVGDFDPDKAAALAGELFGGWTAKKPYSRLVTEYQDIPAVDMPIETPDKANAQMYLGQAVKMRDDHPDYPAMTLANFITGGGFLSSRLAVRIRQKEGLSYGVGSSFSASSEDESGTFFGYAIFSPKDAAKLEKAFREELDRVIADGFTDKEIADAKSGWLQKQVLSRGSDPGLAGWLAGNEYLGRRMAWYGDMEKRVAALKPSEVHEAFKKHIDTSRISFFRAGDFAGAAKKEAAPGGN